MTNTAVTPPPGADTPLGGGLREVLMPRWRTIAISVVATIAVALALLLALPRPHASAVKVINPAKSIAVARTIPNFPLYLPSPLPAGWYPNSSRFSLDWIGAVLHIGYLAPDGGYIGLEQTTGANKRVFVSTISAGAVFDGMVTVAGVAWFHLQSDRKSQDSLVWYGPRSVVVVTGTTTVANLERFAASLPVGH
ncbi:MAG: DUF4245 family protein [Acidothermaceae bacterium]